MLFCLSFLLLIYVYFFFLEVVYGIINLYNLFRSQLLVKMICCIVLLLNFRDSNINFYYFLFYPYFKFKLLLFPYFVKVKSLICFLISYFLIYAFIYKFPSLQEPGGNDSRFFSVRIWGRRRAHGHKITLGS
jgi:hypothetical protein